MPRWGCCWSGWVWKLSPGSCSTRNTRTWSLESMVGVTCSAQRGLVCSQLGMGTRKWQELQPGAEMRAAAFSQELTEGGCWVKCWDHWSGAGCWGKALNISLDVQYTPGHPYGKLGCLGFVCGVLPWVFCSLSIQNMKLCLHLPWALHHSGTVWPQNLSSQVWPL